jgi:formiminotetrahydrofolate cyclodeaminase
MGAALVAMVSGLTIGKKKYAEVEAEMQAVRVIAEKLRAEMTQAVEDDAASFEAVIGAFKLPKDTEEQQTARTAAIQVATMNAAHIPLHSAENSVKIMELAVKCAERGNLKRHQRLDVRVRHGARLAHCRRLQRPHQRQLPAR